MIGVKMFGRILFYFDKVCAEKALEVIGDLCDELSKCPPCIVWNSCPYMICHGICGGVSDISQFYTKPRKENKEWIFCQYVGEPFGHSAWEHPAASDMQEKYEGLINGAIRNYDWDAIGVTGFEEAKHLSDVT